MEKKLVGYGVNIKNAASKLWERYATKVTQEAAEQVFNVLSDPDSEQSYWIDVEIEEIYELENGEFDYKTIKKTNHYMLDSEFWEEKQYKNQKTVYNIEIEADRDPEDGTVYNICWLKLGWYSPYSNSGFFHFSSLEGFETELKRIKPISQCTKEELDKYLEWLSDNECLFEEYSKPELALIYLIIGAAPQYIDSLHYVTK